MKLLFILGILAFLLFVVYLRLRPYIRIARQVFGAADQARRAVREEAASSPAKSPTADQRLVRCGACGTWVPSSRAVKLKAASYCSHACLEATAQGGRRKAAG